MIGTLIGTNSSGSAALPNGGSGILVLNSPNNLLRSNIIFGNSRNGVEISGSGASGNVLRGNRIGDAALPNGLNGILVSNAPQNVIGVPNEGNLVSGSALDGIRLELAGTFETSVKGNYIGLDGPNTFNGIVIVDSPMNTIGGLGLSDPNFISGNGVNGVGITGAGSNSNVILGNWIGFDRTGAPLGNAQRGIAAAAGIQNTFSRNRINSNGLLGIDLFPIGVTANDPGDVDTGPNDLQNFPALTAAVNDGPTGRILGTLNSTPSTAFTIEFFDSPSCDSSGNGEGDTFLGSLAVSTDAAGNATFNYRHSGSFFDTLTVGHAITATATNAAGSTSELSACRTAANCTAPAPPTASNNGPICIGQTLQLSSSTVAGATYSWTGPNGFASTLQNPSIPAATAADSGTYRVAVNVGGCTSAEATTNATVSADTVAPTVTAPAPIIVNQSTCCGVLSGASGATSPALATFLAGGSASDSCDSSPTRLAPRIGGVDASNATCFQAGSTTVTFRFQDDAGNIGSATSSVTVRMFGDLTLDSAIDAADTVILRAYLNFAASPATPPFNAPLTIADVNHDSVVDATDLVLLRGYLNFAVSCLAP